MFSKKSKGEIFVVQLVGSSSLGLGKLIDGKNQFVHIRYSAKPDGSNMTSEIQPDTKYIGIATSSSETAPTSPSDYSWGRFVGTSGSSSYTWIRYSANEDGSNMTTIANEDTKYIGVAITDEDSAPTDHTRYSWALFKGSDGRGVERTEVSYQKSRSGTVIPTGSWSASIPSVNDGEYLWTRTLFFYTDGTTTSTFTVSRNGIAGLGIANTDVHYQKSTSGTTVPTGAWTVTIPKVAPNEYLWTRTTITYTDDSSTVSYSVGKMGADGRDAQLLYLTATSEIQAFDNDDKPKTTEAIIISAKLQNVSGAATFVAIPYIGNTAQPTITLGGTGNDRTLLPSQWTNTKWTSIAITATLGSLTDTVSVHKVKDGEKGDNGADGSPGVGIESTTITYAASTSGTVHPTSGWSATIPSVPSGQYLWTRTVWTYTNGIVETSYSVSKMGERGPQGLEGAQGPKGDQGKDGVAGKDGVGVRSTVITYGLSDSETTQPTSWSAQVPTLAKGKYLWTKIVWAYTDGTSETSYQKTYIARDGNDGADGIPGKDGVGINSTTITYAVSESGTTKPVGGWSTTVPTVPSGQYLWTRTVWSYTDSTSEIGYSVAKMGERGPQGPQGLQGIQGPKGDQGIAGRPGADGRTSYTHIAYADSADGTKNFSTSDSNRIYIGVYVDFNATDSTSPGSYQWSLIKGADGADGLPGKPGADGRTPYFHTAYANSSDGSSDFSTTDSNGKLYLGTCTDYNQADPTDYRVYTWVKIKGQDGKGVKSYAITYQAGTSGTTPPTGTWSSTIPTVPKGQYLWSKTTLTYTDNTTSDTYSVAYFPVNGATGNGISSYTAEFYLSTSKTTQTGGSWTTTPPTWSSGKYLWTRYKIGYTNGSTAYTTPHCSSEWEAVNEIQIGGRNLLFKTGYFDTSQLSVIVGDGNKINLEKTIITDENSPSGKAYRINKYKKGTENVYGGCYWSMPKKLVEGKKYTWSAYVRGVGAIDAVGPEQGGLKSVKLTDAWTKVSHTFTANGDKYYQFTFYGSTEFDLYLTDLMLEEGTMPSPWSPAPEDIQSQVDNIQVGSRNLLKDTANFGNNRRPSGSKDGWLNLYDSSIESEKYNGLTVRSLKSVSSMKSMCDYYFTGFNLGDTYTLSFWAKGTIDRFRCYFHGDSGYVKARAINASIPYYNATVYADGYCSFINPKITNWTRISVTWELDSVGDINIAKRVLIRTDEATGGDFYVCGVKLEKGNKATDWTPAPEDTQDQIDQANENISNKVDQGAYDQDKSVIYDDINKKLDDEEFREFQKIMNELKGSYDSFVGEGGRFEQELKNASEREQAIVQEFGNKVNQLNFINTYIRESEEGIVIGAKNSPMQMLLSKDSLSFMDGGQTVAYFSNQSFYINRGAVVESLQVGVHKLTKIGNEHTVIQYIPQ